MAKLYAYLYVFIQLAFGVNMPGLGFLLRRCKEPRFVDFQGERVYFEPRVASSYGLHIINRAHEPESHQFLNAVFENLTCEKCFFIDTGANIGIFMVDIARRDNVHVVGFEPSLACVEAIERSMQANGRHNFDVFNNLYSFALS
jgi:tRNA G46 methylase TrmB